MPQKASKPSYKSPFGKGPITLASVLNYRDSEPRRIDFKRTHSNALSKKRVDNDPEIVGKFSVPFAETVKPLFEECTGVKLFRSPKYGNYWVCIKSEEEFKRIEGWFTAQGSRILLRDCLDLSVALDSNFEDATSGAYTELGNLEHCAKFSRDSKAIERLSLACAEAIQELPFYRDAPLIAAVPPMSNKQFDLPSEVAARVAAFLGKHDLTQHFRCTQPKELNLKAARIEEKWTILDATGLSLSFEIAGRDVVLIDDKYQSGTTMQFVAMKLQQAGARHVFGISLVKTLRDTDNAS